jgi:hypothetical protein
MAGRTARRVRLVVSVACGSQKNTEEPRQDAPLQKLEVVVGRCSVRGVVPQGFPIRRWRCSLPPFQHLGRCGKPQQTVLGQLILGDFEHHSALAQVLGRDDLGFEGLRHAM